MRRDAFAFALVISVVGGGAIAASARAEEPARGTTEAERDVTGDSRPRPGELYEIYILRGSGPKEQAAVAVPEPPKTQEKKKAEPAKTRKARRWRSTHGEPDDE